MNRDDIIRMARDAGLYVGTNLSGVTLVGLRPCLGGSYEDDGLLVHLDLDDIERFAALVAAAEREKSLRLWMLLDDIDTAGDIAKSDDKLYRHICQNLQKKRWEILSGEEVDAAIRARSEG